MNYFKGEGIFVEVPKTTTRMSEIYKITLKIDEKYGFVDEAKIIINQQKGTNEREITMKYVATEGNMNIFSCNVPFDEVGLYYFCIKIILNGETKWVKNNVQNECTCITTDDMQYWTITVYDDNYHVPDWAKGKIMYQIFPDRFFRSKKYVPNSLEGRVTKKWGDIPNWVIGEDGEVCNNDYFMGNLRGISEKLKYLAKLGVEIIYLNPIVMGQSNHRYDVADYEKVDPYLGTNDDLKQLCDAAHKCGIKIIADGVFNHTGSNSKYFNQFGKYDTIGAFQGNESPYYNWYRKNQEGNFEYWWGFKNLPVCDGNNSGWQQFIYGEGGIIDKWFSLGIDGLRLDVADELTEEFIENIRIAVKRNKPDGLIIGEVWENAITKEAYGKQRTYLLGKGLDTVMNYPFTNAILKYVRFGKAKYLVETIEEIKTYYPEDALFSLMNSLSTHDITRCITTLVADGIQNGKNNWVWDVPYSREWQFANSNLSDTQYNNAKKLMKIATVIQYFLPGNPCIYYGDEVGMYGYKDPFNRMCFPWKKTDNDLLDFFAKIGKVRKECTFLKDADINIIQADEDKFIFERIGKKDIEDKAHSSEGVNKVLVAVNRTAQKVKIKIPEEYIGGKNTFKNNASEDAISGYGILIKNAK